MAWFRRARTSETDVSVIIPVYNAGRYLAELLDSLAAQDIGLARFEVIAIDDGSTDGSGDVLDAYVQRMKNLRVVHQENSGWPGIPRNLGMSLSNGRYVFFADADDRMGPKALSRMVDFADQHGSDVVVPKVLGLDGRWVRSADYAKTQVDADLMTVFRTLTPQKLFRRSFLVETGIKFPTEKVRLEDGMVLAQAYLRARRVSILGGYNFYFLRARGDGGNISATPLDPVGYTWSIGEVSRLIRLYCSDKNLADDLVLDLYRRKCLKIYVPERWSGYSLAKRKAWIAAHHEFLEREVPAGVEARLSSPFLERSRAVRTGDLAAVNASVAREGASAPIPRRAARDAPGDTSAPVALVALTDNAAGVTLEIRSNVPRTIDDVVLVGVGRASGGRSEWKASRQSPGSSVFTVQFGSNEVAPHSGDIIDFWLVQDAGSDAPLSRRVAVDHDYAGSIVEVDGHIRRWYRTVKSNLSLEVAAWRT